MLCVNSLVVSDITQQCRSHNGPRPWVAQDGELQRAQLWNRVDWDSGPLLVCPQERQHYFPSLFLIVLFGKMGIPISQQGLQEINMQEPTLGELVFNG